MTFDDFIVGPACEEFYGDEPIYDPEPIDAILNELPPDPLGLEEAAERWGLPTPPDFDDDEIPF